MTNPGLLKRKIQSDLTQGIRLQNVSRIRSSLANGADPNAEDDLGFAPIHIAALHQNRIAIKILHAAGANPRRLSKSELFPLSLAALYGSVDTLRALTEYCADFEPTTQSARSALEHALAAGQYDAAKFLLMHGADLVRADQDGLSLFSRLCISGDSSSIELLQSFLPSLTPTETAHLENMISAMGGNNLQQALASTERNHARAEHTLHECTSSRAERLWSSLLNLSLVNVKLKLIRTFRAVASHIILKSTRTQDFGTVRTILDTLAPPSAHGGDNAATQSNFWQTINTLILDGSQSTNSLAMRVIEKSGLLGYAEPQTWKNILHIAAQCKNHLFIAEILQTTNSNALLNRSDTLNNRPLHYASLTGCADSIHTLSQFGGDLNPCNSYGLTPLHIAVSNSDVKCTDLLLKKGANPFLSTRNNQDVLDLIDASSPAADAILELIVEYRERSKLLDVFSENSPFAPFIKKYPSATRSA